MQMRLGELLVRNELISEQELSLALESQKTSNRRRLGEILLESEKVSRSDLLKMLALQLEILFLNLEKTEIDEEAARLIPHKLASKYCCLPVRKEGKGLLVAMADPLNLQAIDALNQITKCEIKTAVADPKQIQAALKRFHGRKVQEFSNSTPEMEVLFQIVNQNDFEEDQELSVADLKIQSQQAPIVRIVNVVIHEAIQERASDIHIEPQADSVIVRQRIDGILYEKHLLPQWIHPAVASRIKIMANMNIAEKRLPQDGKIRISMNSRYFDLRISSVPTIFGEKIVIRILNRKESQVKLDDLGLGPQKLSQIRSLNARKQGLILLTGPTGSGKSTTLNSILHELRSPEVNIVTVEDPVEYDIAKTNQIQVNPKAGLTFPLALRSILRQDPDIIMVGEIRDSETAEIAIRAAMTGHLVLSTLHTNDAISAVARLVNLGTPRFLISSTLLYILAQRLVRRLCKDCTEEYEPTDSQLSEIERIIPQACTLPWKRGVGCPKCKQRGYEGRIAIGELFAAEDEVRKAIELHEPELVLQELAFKNGMTSLISDFIEKVGAGITAITEVWNVVVGQELVSAFCPNCSGHIERSFAACPSCGLLLKEKCPNCNNPVERSWRFCPFCRKEREARGESLPKQKL